MRILLTGANGFLGHTLVPLLLQKGHSVIATGKGENRLHFPALPPFSYRSLDFTDAAEAERIVALTAPEVVIHAGAMTRVDECEQQPEDAWRCNVNGTLQLLEAAAALKAFFLFVSTDFVFSGEKGMYTETDATGPVNFYGRTKLEAEERVMRYPSDWAIVRTCLVYGKPVEGRANILSVLHQKAEKGETYAVVDDQFRTPTLVDDLAAGIWAIAEKKATGVFHISGDELLTPYRMALRTAAFMGTDPGLFKRVTASDFSQPALRPPRTGFNLAKAKRELGYQPHSFDEGLKKSLE